jgi:hypothetical protein
MNHDQHDQHDVRVDLMHYHDCACDYVIVIVLLCMLCVFLRCLCVRASVRLCIVHANDNDEL